MDVQSQQTYCIDFIIFKVLEYLTVLSMFEINVTSGERITVTCYFVLQLLAEEKAVSERNALERDNAEREARQNETKVRTAISSEREFSPCFISLQLIVDSSLCM